MIRVNVYIDGYNLYHAIDNLNDDALKWLDLRSLMQNFTDPAIHDLQDVYYFSAYATWKNKAYQRHKLYQQALSANGVKTVMGSFKEKDRFCRACNARWIAHEEKETDVNIALYLLNDAHLDVYDEAIIVSQDSDLFPAIKMVKKQFPQKSIKIITPPGLKHSKEMAKVVGKKKLGEIKRIHIERSLFGKEIKISGTKLITRPQKYDG
ncbi:MAG: NYN domain-containing protein [Bdellovibrionales bacterium]